MKNERSSGPGLERFISVQNALRAAGALALAGTVYGVMRMVQHFRQLPEPQASGDDGYRTLLESEEGIEPSTTS